MGVNEFKILETGTPVVVTLPKALNECADRDTEYIFIGLRGGMYEMLYDDNTGNGMSFPESCVKELAKRTRLNERYKKGEVERNAQGIR